MREQVLISRFGGGKNVLLLVQVGLWLLWRFHLHRQCSATLVEVLTRRQRQFIAR